MTAKAIQGRLRTVGPVSEFVLGKTRRRDIAI
jgi:hypothetical protein